MQGRLCKQTEIRHDTTFHPGGKDECLDSNNKVMQQFEKMAAGPDEISERKLRCQTTGKRFVRKQPATCLPQGDASSKQACEENQQGDHGSWSESGGCVYN